MVGQIFIANDEWWHRRVQAPIQLETLSPVATHGLLADWFCIEGVVFKVDHLQRISADLKDPNYAIFLKTAIQVLRVNKCNTILLPMSKTLAPRGATRLQENLLVKEI
jgi:hypothetical protein